MVDSNHDLKFALVGRLQRDFILPLRGKPVIDALGGGLAYAAAGLRFWGETAGLVARVSPDYPSGWLEQFTNLGFDLNGIQRVTESFDQRWFAAYDASTGINYDNPLTHFAARGLAFPPQLLSYESEIHRQCSKNQYCGYSIHVNDVPINYRDVRAAHVGPLDFLSHKILPSIFRTGLVQTVTMCSAPGYMDPNFWEDMPALLTDLTAFMTSKDEALRLFQGRSVDLWEIAAHLAQLGPEYVLIRLPDGGQYLYDGISKKRWIVPSYSVQVADPTCSADVFSGAFLASYQQVYDPLEAALMGNIAASFANEGSGPFYLLDALTGLREARLAVLRELVSQI